MKNFGGADCKVWGESAPLVGCQILGGGEYNSPGSGTAQVNQLTLKSNLGYFPMSILSNCHTDHLMSEVGQGVVDYYLTTEFQLELGIDRVC